MYVSPNWHDGKFRNPQPLWNDTLGTVSNLFRANPHGMPAENEVPVVHPSPAELGYEPASGLRATWFGHSTVLLDIDGVRVLTDPMWSDRPSPVSWIGPKRWYAPPVPLGELPRPDVVVISHDHYDHLDRPSIEAMRGWQRTTFVVPLGGGAYLVQWGIPPAHIIELDWWQSATVGALNITATPARHASGRGLLDKDKTFWAGFAFRTSGHRVYFSGDTGLFQELSEIGRRLGPFDLTLIEIGAYDAAWPDWHLGPEQALLAHCMVRGAIMLPIHWGLFELAKHSWTEPVERLMVAAQLRSVRFPIPRPGETFDVSGVRPHSRWWPTIPWRSAQEAPIVSTPNGETPTVRN